MGFRFKFEQNPVVISSLSEKKQRQLEAMLEKYSGKIYDTREDFLKAKKEADDEIIKITGGPVYKTSFKYGQHSLTAVMGGLDNVINTASSPEQEMEWSALKQRLIDITARQHTALDDASDWPVVTQLTGNFEGDTTQIALLPESLEAEADALMKEINELAAKEYLKLAGSKKNISDEVEARIDDIKKDKTFDGFNVDEYRKNNFLMLNMYTDYARKNSAEADHLLPDDYILVDSYGSYIPGFPKYGEELKGDNAANKNPYLSDYVRVNRLLPLSEVPLIVMHSVSARKEYDAAKKAGNIKRADEIKIRQELLTSYAAEIYRLDKISRNISNDKVKETLRKNEVPGATDMAGPRNFAKNYRAMNTFRRSLISYGWPMEDIDVLGKAKYLAETMDSVSAGVSNEEKEKIRNYSLTLSAIPATEPLNEEARRRHFDNLIAALDGFSMEERRRYPYFEDLMSLVKKAREYQPSDVEKQLMADPGELKQLADDNPLREYKSTDQYNDLQLLAQEQQKDYELNDIYQADPWAHDNIRILQAQAVSESVFVDSVKAVVGEKVFEKYNTKSGRPGDYEKALDILTSPSSPHLVSKDHELLEKVRSELSIRNDIVSHLNDIDPTIGDLRIGENADPKVKKAQEKLKGIWVDYVAEKRNGPIGQDREKEYCSRIREQYGIIADSLPPEQSADAKKIRDEMESRRQAVELGWTLSEAGLRSRLKDAFDKMYSYGEEHGSVKDMLILRDKTGTELKKSQVLGKFSEWLSNSKLDSEIIGVNKEGLAAELKYYKRQAEIEEQMNTIKRAQGRLYNLKEKGIEPYVQEELDSFINKDRKIPAWNLDFKDTSFLTKADSFIKENKAADHIIDYLEAVNNGRETTFAARTALQPAIAISKIHQMLKSTDSYFHKDSAQFKAVKEDLKKFYDAPPDQKKTQKAREKLTADVRKWLTDPKYDRIHKHNKNQFDNTRFNYMFTLMNELDPEWAKAHFSEMNLSAFHGDKAEKSAFYNVYDFLGFTQKQIVDAHYTDIKGPEGTEIGADYAKKMLWYNNINARGEGAMVAEAERIRMDASYAARDRLTVELDNLNKLTGDADGMTSDNVLKAKLSLVNSYRQRVDKVLENNNEIVERMDKDPLKNLRENAIDQVKTFLNDPENSKNQSLYQKAVAAYGVLDPKGAHTYITEYNARHAGDKKVKKMSLLELEKQQKLDIGARKDYNRKKAERYDQKQAQKQGPAVPVNRP